MVTLFDISTIFYLYLHNPTPKALRNADSISTDYKHRYKEIRKSTKTEDKTATDQIVNDGNQ